MTTTPTSKERFLAACRGERSSAPPAWMMRQAGRYLPEYREIRKGKDFLTMVHTPKLAAEVTCQPLRRFDMDVAVIFCDILVPPAAMGLEVEFKEGVGPVLGPPVRNAADIKKLRDFDAATETGFLGEAIRLVREEIGQDKAIMGFCGAPWTTASYMIEGGSSRNFENAKQLLYGEPEVFEALVERLVDNLIPYLGLQVEAGADALQIFDSWGGALDAATYKKRILPGLKRLVTGAKSFGVPVILYVNGCSQLIDVLLESEPDVLSIDWRIDPLEASQRIGLRAAIQGNLDPTSLFAPPEVVSAMVRETIEAFADHPGYIFNLGSGILPRTPLESVEALFDTVRSFRTAT